MLAADVSNYISDHTGWFVAALAAAILLLLLVVPIMFFQNAQAKADRQGS